MFQKGFEIKFLISSSLVTIILRTAVCTLPIDITDPLLYFKVIAAVKFEPTVQSAIALIRPALSLFLVDSADLREAMLFCKPAVVSSL